MKKQLSTKKALMLSVLSLCLCLAMLLGTTFAWFTDEVTVSPHHLNIQRTGLNDVTAAGHLVGKPSKGGT